jgi:hypothetical protein
MEFVPLSKEILIKCLEDNGTRPEKIKEIEKFITRKKLQIAMDDKCTVITDGKRVGWAKRATYARRGDELSFMVGVSIAINRYMNGNINMGVIGCAQG